MFDSRDLTFLWKSSDLTVQKFIEEINVYGPEVLTENISKNKSNKLRNSIKTMIDYMLLNKRFLEKFHNLNCLMTACIRSNSIKDALSAINRKSSAIFKGFRRVNVWV
jgi:hypothetical protein